MDIIFCLSFYFKIVQYVIEMLYIGFVAGFLVLQGLPLLNLSLNISLERDFNMYH